MKRRILYSAIGAIGGAATHTLMNGEPVPILGAVIGGVLLFTYYELGGRRFQSR